ncbi:diguanylate cyclase [Pandoraea fibrosis]|uniref:diguanylate cyclase n=1 Tax=Pandoraea fibrosis TaxID=1891094 RepID=A0A5E4TKI4_9BURK|nr:diguanylate cyclase [Pandoraea fibrosis]VVD87074.1 Phytochrome-like protein cph2 [Pandoraea fibrosis]
MQKVLVVDDAAINRQVLTDLLKSDCTVILAKNGEQALTLAAQHRPDLILLDVVMPEVTGYDVLRRLKSDPHTAAIAVVFITGLDTPEDEENGLTLGASDYITKPFNLAVVRARVRLHLQLARQRRMLETMANVDGLTEIANRRYFDDRYATEWAHAVREGRPLSVAILDIDFFKEFNDRAGHAMGDRVLQGVASILTREMVRSTDLVARYGGEEFVVLMPGTEAEGAARFAERLREATSRLPLLWSDAAHAGQVTVSLGGATLQPGTDESAAALLKAADDHLYRAKKEGRNRVVWRESSRDLSDTGPQ